MTIADFPVMCAECGKRIWWNPVYAWHLPYHRECAHKVQPDDGGTTDGMPQEVPNTELSRGGTPSA